MKSGLKREREGEVFGNFSVRRIIRSIVINLNKAKTYNGGCGCGLNTDEQVVLFYSVILYFTYI